MYTSRQNEKACCITQVNLITEDRMPRYKYLYEIRMFTNKMKCSIFGREGKG